MVRQDITLRGEKAERWNEAIDTLEDRLGYRPNQPEALMLILASSELGNGLEDTLESDV